MPLIYPRGSKTAPVWVICERPLSTDKDRGHLFSGALGMVYSKMLDDAGFKYSDIYITARAPDSDDPSAFLNIIGELNQYRPPLIIALDRAGWFLCKKMEPTSKKVTVEGMLEKQIGSLLTSEALTYPHYVCCTYGPQKIAAQYKLRDIVVACDLGKVQGELEYFRKHGRLQPLPDRTLRTDLTFDEIIQNLKEFEQYDLISNDIETIYPKRGSTVKTTSKLYKIHPGYPITIGLAPNTLYGISFLLFRDSEVETRILWQRLNDLLRKVPQLGQNFFNFDLNFYEMLGFETKVSKIKDTMIRHHILWPELPHKLQFQTRQYTREPYYKDEGHGWTGKDLSGLQRYNALDCCVTMEVYEKQEDEFADRPYLR